jgi:hypothetical protein
LRFPQCRSLRERGIGSSKRRPLTLVRHRLQPIANPVSHPHHAAPTFTVGPRSMRIFYASPASFADCSSQQFSRAQRAELLALIVGLVPVATRGHRTKGRLRWPPSTELRRSRKSVSGGLAVGHSKVASFDHLVGAGSRTRANPNDYHSHRETNSNRTTKRDHDISKQTPS